MGSSANGINGLTEQLPSPTRACVVDKGVDFANYFCTYAFLYHQKEMLSDRVRMDAYCMSIFKNKHHFKNKTVLDVGTGSGILAIWCAQAGARKVYAVEATKMSEHARQLVKANNLQDVVEVIEGSIEDITLPEKVDVIISEWMGYFLLRESMLDSVICARDRWLKQTGMMYPSHARIWIAPIRSGLGNQRKNDYDSAMIDWDNFVDDTHNHYGVNMRVLTDSYRKENEKYYLQVSGYAVHFYMLAQVRWMLDGSLTSLWSNLEPDQVVGIPSVIMELDCLTATVDDIRSLNAKYSTSISMESAIVAGFAGWFDVHFRGNQSNPAQHEIELSTAPSKDKPTHWGQQVFLLNPSFIVKGGDKITGSFSMTRSVENHRLLNVEFSYHLQKSTGELLNSASSKFYID